MTLEKAIEILEQDLNTHLMLNQMDQANAIKLGIEAMKRAQRQRKTWLKLPDALLPGETKE